MLRRIVCGMAVIALGVGIAVADEFRGVIKKVDGGKITLAKSEGKGKGKQKLGPDMTLTAASTIKVAKGKYNRQDKKFEVGEALEGGLSNKLFTEIGDKGVPARITTDGDQITQIVVTEGGRRKKKNQ